MEDGKTKNTQRPVIRATYYGEKVPFRDCISNITLPKNLTKCSSNQLELIRMLVEWGNK